MKRYVAFALLLLLVSPSQAQVFRNLFQKKKNVEVADTVKGLKRVEEVMNLLQTHYVSDPNTDKLSEDAVRNMLRTLDPHSIYVPAREVQRTNEALQGNFEGVGITFAVMDDTIRVQEVLAGGPAEKVGMLPGDKFLSIDNVIATGDSAKNSFVLRHLRGKKGTTVVVDALRGSDSITFHMVRDRIPIHSIEVSFMEEDSIGYISLLRFARTSVTEFRKALKDLKKQGMKSLVLDLRGNSGGFLDIAYGMANEFISTGRLIVYQQGRARKRQDFRANRHGSFRKGDLVVLIDEGSASASEIVSGAVQDWDRGLIVGRRSFGKGLVQTMYNLSDGSQVRITTARYYTPSGRCIQRPYDEGTDEYNKDIQRRYKHGELFTADSVHFPDSLKFKTFGGRTVYGGGGIMPDIFVPMDTTPATPYYTQCRRKGLINQFPQYWAGLHRKELSIKDFPAFMACYDSLGVDTEFVSYAASKGVNLDSLLSAPDSVTGVVADTVAAPSDSLSLADIDPFLHLQIKALLADNLFGRGHYYQIMKERDPVYQTAVAQLRKQRQAAATALP